MSYKVIYIEDYYYQPKEIDIQKDASDYTIQMQRQI